MFEYQTTEVPTESFFFLFLISMSFFSINAIGGVVLRFNEFVVTARRRHSLTPPCSGRRLWWQWESSVDPCPSQAPQLGPQAKENSWVPRAGPSARKTRSVKNSIWNRINGQIYFQRFSTRATRFFSTLGSASVFPMHFLHRHFFFL